MNLRQTVSVVASGCNDYRVTAVISAIGAVVCMFGWGRLAVAAARVEGGGSSCDM